MQKDTTGSEGSDGAGRAWGVAGKVILTIGPFALLAGLMALHRWAS